MIQRIHPVDHTQMWRKRVGRLVAVVALKGDAVFDNAQVGVRINKARQQNRTPCVNILRRKH